MTDKTESGTEQPTPQIAAIDMGSNSFHMVIARPDEDEIRPVQKLAEKVMLAAGLDADSNLDQPSFDRGLECLRRFAQCLEGIDPKWVRCVGTNTLRKARNGEAFLREARKILNCPVEVVAGREEARLIYLGVSHSLASSPENRLVFDIGGGSTEFIIGREFEPILTESLHMGCVSFRDRYFASGKITEAGFSKAVLKTRVEVSSIEREYRDQGWSSAVGASGTVKAIKNALIENGWYNDGIDKEGLYKLRDMILGFNTLDDIDIPGIKAERRLVLPSGLAIMIGIFEQLGVDKLRFSDGAMREGILYDMLGRHAPEDVRMRTIRGLMKRSNVDEAQAERVRKTAIELFLQTRVDWDFGEFCQDWLTWAALTHEVGLMVAHSGYHRHGAYLLTHSDLPGFTRQDQTIIAAMVVSHRRKIRDTLEEPIQPHLQEKVKRLVLVLRLAVVFHRTRRDGDIPRYKVKPAKDGVKISFEPDWIQAQPLLLAELQQEQDYWKKVEYNLEFE